MTLTPSSPTNLWNILSENQKSPKENENFGVSRTPANLWNILSDSKNFTQQDFAVKVNDFKNMSTQIELTQDNIDKLDHGDSTSDSDQLSTSDESISTTGTEHSNDESPTIEELLVSRASTLSAKPANAKTSELTSKIVTILKCYSPQTETQVSRSIMEKVVYYRVEQELPIHLILPAFPFKSPNRVDKVLGALPDMGEELALAKLDGLCAQIDEVYPGTTLSIISDGLVYSDLLGVSEEDVWNYGTELRRLAKKRFPRISFARLSKLVSEECSEPQNLETYLANASWYRNELIKNNLPNDFDINQELKQINALMTYRGYIKFLSTDLKHEESRQGKSKSQVKKMNEKVAKRMIERGAAFALAAQKAFPTSIRISIHRSESRYKLPISLFTGGGESYTTPWHCVCALELDGSWRYAHKRIFAEDPEYKLIHENERPSYYRRRSELYSWDGYEVDMTPIYPCGIFVSPKKSNASRSIDNIDMLKIRKLSEYNSPIVLRGFENTTELSLFQSKAREMGPVMPWKFGEVLVVKDAGSENGGLNNVLSAEPMPMHFDGLFKTELVKDENGEKRLVPRPPKFQWFTVATPAPQSCGFTLIASSRILLDLLPRPYTIEQLQQLTWTVSTTAFNNSKISKLPLVEPHPSLGTPCLRYHEPWPMTRTKFDPTDVYIDDMSREKSKSLMDTIDSLLYDRRVCYYHEWVEGDLILSDNISMMHTRTSFIPGAPRELWRIHID